MSDNPNIIGARYEMLDLLGQGGMATVYRGRDLRDGTIVAIKLLKREIVALDPGLVERFTREAEALRVLNHPNIVKVLELIEQNGDYYAVMEYVSGGDLRTLLERGERLPIPRVLNIALDLADALTRAHRLKIVHRDIKPANVLMAEDGTPRLTDFGIARVGDESRITQTGQMMGTLAYLSPEGAVGDVLDTRADIWSFGVVLYEMLAGRRPYEAPDGNQAALLVSILSHSYPALAPLCPDAPPELVRLIDQMLEKDRDKRIQSVRQIGAQLEALLANKQELASVDDTPTTNAVMEQLSTDPLVMRTQNPTPTPVATWRPTSRRIIDPPLRIFISYLRGDSAAIAGRIYDHLIPKFGKENLYKDVDAGAVEATVERCNVLLVVIGKQWEKAVVNDPARFEIETGLMRDTVLVIPVFVNQAIMPTHLPDILQEILYRNATVVRDDPDFTRDLNWLIERITTSFEFTRSHLRRNLIAAALLILALAGAGFIGVYLSQNQPAAEITVDPVAANEYMILVANLQLLEGTTRDPADDIYDDLQRKLEVDVPFSSYRLRRYPAVISSRDHAAQVAERTGAVIVIWGDYNGTTARVNMELGSTAALGAMLIPLDQVVELTDVRYLMTNPREQSLLTGIVAIMNAAQSSADNAYQIALNLSIMDILKPTTVTPPVEGISVAARWHQYIDAFSLADAAMFESIDTALRLKSNPILYLGRAFGDIRAGNLAEARSDLRSAAALMSDSVTCDDVLLAGLLILVEYQPEEAVQLLTQVLMINPDDWFSYTYRGVAYYLMGDYASASADFKQALSINADNPMVYPFFTAVLLREGDVLGSQQAFLTVRREYPNPYFLENLYGATFDPTPEDSPIISGIAAFTNFALERWDEVILNAENTINHSTLLFPDAYLLKGVAQCNLDDYAGAETSYTELLDLQPDFVMVRSLRAEVRLKLNNTLGAGTDFAAVLASPLASAFAPFVPGYQSGDITCKTFFSTDLTQYMTP